MIVENIKWRKSSKFLGVIELVEKNNLTEPIFYVSRKRFDVKSGCKFTLSRPLQKSNYTTVIAFLKNKNVAKKLAELLYLDQYYIGKNQNYSETYGNTKMDW